MSAPQESPKEGSIHNLDLDAIVACIKHDAEAGKWNIYPLVVLEESLERQIRFQEIQDKGQPLSEEDRSLLENIAQQDKKRIDWYSLDMFGPESFCYAVTRAMAILEEQGMNFAQVNVPSLNESTKKDVSYYLCHGGSVGLIQLGVNNKNSITAVISSTNLSSRKQTKLLMYENIVSVFLETGIKNDPNSRVRKEIRFSRIPYLLFYKDIDLDSAKDLLAMTHFLVSLAPLEEVKKAREYEDTSFQDYDGIEPVDEPEEPNNDYVI